MHLNRTKSTAVLAAAFALALSLSTTAFAKDRDRPGDHRVVLGGIITGVTTTTAGVELTLDRGQRDDDASDDVTIRISDTTRIAPPGAKPAVGLKARAVATALTADRMTFAATLLVLGGRAKPEQHPLEACGAISALPAGGTVGDWTVHVPDVADYTFAVTADTRINPKHVDPAVGMRACFQARAAEAGGWIAHNIELKPKGHKGGDDHDEHARVELNGVAMALPADRSVTWTLTISLTMQAAGTTANVLVTPDTEIEGELVAGARVAVRASRAFDAAGNVVLTAQKIKVLGAPAAPGGDDHGAVKFEGKVTAISADGKSWSIKHDGDVVVVTVDANTHIVGLIAGASVLGREVEGKAVVQADGSLLAKQLRIKRD